MTDPKMLRELFDMESAPLIPLSLQDISFEAQGMVGKMSISGVQPKLSLKLNKSKGELILAPEGGEYILKPQISQFPHTPENENCCMDIAMELAIDVPPHCLLALKDNTLAYIVKRFDRHGQEKLHQENFFQVLAKKDKYMGSIEEIGKKLREISTVPGLDVQLFFERVVFNFLIGNGDAHFQNYSITYPQEGQIRLAPAYDIVCTKLVIPNEEDSALTLNGKKNNLTRHDFDALAEELKIPEKVRYEKFHRKQDRIKEFVEGSSLPADFQRKFAGIVRLRYERLGIDP